MSRVRTHAYIEMSINPKQLGKLKSGYVVHKQLAGCEERVAIRIKHPLDKRISYHRNALLKLLKDRKTS